MRKNSTTCSIPVGTRSSFMAGDRVLCVRDETCCGWFYIGGASRTGYTGTVRGVSIMTALSECLEPEVLVELDAVSRQKYENAFGSGGQTFFRESMLQKLEAPVTQKIVVPKLPEAVPVPISTCPSHTEIAFDIYSLPRIVQWAERHVLEVRAQAIVVCGHSGLVVGGALSYATRIPVFAVRKTGESNQCRASSNEVSAVAPSGTVERWVWFDDCVSSGTTFRRAATVCKRKKLIKSTVPSLVLLYNQRTYGTLELSIPFDADETEYTFTRIPAQSFLNQD